MHSVLLLLMTMNLVQLMPLHCPPLAFRDKANVGVVEHKPFAIHALEELITDFFPHWVYRSSSRRFVRADAPGGDAHEVPPPARPNKLEAIDQVGGSAGTGTRATNPSPLSKYMSKAMSLYNNYVG